MTQARTESEIGEPGGGQARLLASGSLTQQVAQVSGLLVMFAIITVLARRLTLSELGVYGLLTSLAGYLLVIQNAAANAAVRNMAAARDEEARSRAFSSAAAVFTAAGLATGLLVALVGIALSRGVNLAPALRDEAVRGSLLLGLVTAVGWPLTIYRDALRANQRFIRAALMDITGLVLYGATVLTLVFAGASLEVVIGASGSIPLFAGICSALASRSLAVRFHFKVSSVSRGATRELLGLASYVSATEAAAVVIYALDRAILGLFRSAATVGLYEGPVRAHNVIRALQGAVGVTVLPTAAKYLADGDDRRLRELMLKGTRYTMALVIPLTLTGMVLAEPILRVWLGGRYVSGGPTMTILLSYWLVTASVGVAAAILIAAGHARDVARYAWVSAIANLAMSLVLTPLIGLEGVAIGTAIPYFGAFPFVVRLILRVLELPLAPLAREAWIPAYTTGAGLAIALGVVRLTLPLDSVAAVVLTAAAGVLGYWLAFYAIWLRPAERRLVLDVAGGLLPRRARS